MAIVAAAAVVGLIYNYSNTDTWYCGGILAYQQYTMCINILYKGFYNNIIIPRNWMVIVMRRKIEKDVFIRFMRHHSFLHKKIKYLILIEFICTILCGIHRANPHPIYYIVNNIDDYYIKF